MEGYRVGDTVCHSRQALMVNYGNATGEDIFKLSDRIKLSVKENLL
ncbi:MAG: hypothetical protein IPL04_17725 [Chitinophagaceae bacterium]|nr:hypothetical protein [Chitinophagaceae bacterium]